MIESKSQASMRSFTPPQQVMLTMYTFGALTFLSEFNEVPEAEHILVLDTYLQRQGLTDKQSVTEARTIIEQAKDSSMHWGVEIGYNTAMYWHKEKDANAPKALARLLKTTRK